MYLSLVMNDGAKPSSSLGSLPFSLTQRNCRYDGQIAVFGSKLQDALAKQRYFLVSRPIAVQTPFAECPVAG